MCCTMGDGSHWQGLVFIVLCLGFGSFASSVCVTGILLSGWMAMSMSFVPRGSSLAQTSMLVFPVQSCS